MINNVIILDVHSTNVGVMLFRRDIRWTNINPIIGWYIVIAGIDVYETLVT